MKFSLLLHSLVSQHPVSVLEVTYVSVSSVLERENRYMQIGIYHPFCMTSVRAPLCIAVLVLVFTLHLGAWQYAESSAFLLWL